MNQFIRKKGLSVKHAEYLGSFDIIYGDWKAYCNRLDIYFLVNDVNPNMRLPILVSVIGDAAYEVLIQVCLPRSPLECSFDEVIAIMEDFYETKTSCIYERYKFKRCHQTRQQTIDSYLKELHKLSKHCKFGATLDDNIRDQLIYGVCSDVIRDKLLGENDLTLNKAEGMAKAMESKLELKARNVHTHQNLKTLSKKKDKLHYPENPKKTHEEYRKQELEKRNTSAEEPKSKDHGMYRVQGQVVRKARCEKGRFKFHALDEAMDELRVGPIIKTREK